MLVSFNSLLGYQTVYIANQIDISHLQVSVSKARAIIVLASDENADQVISNFLCPYAPL